MPPPPLIARLGALQASLGLLAAVGGCGGCGEPETAAPAHPILLVGIDGLEPTLVAELLEEGKLPQLARFAREGVIGRLDSMVPTYSPVIWTTIATGQLPDAHGITFFHDDEGRPYTSNARKVPALWNLVSDAELTVDSVGWWNTWPAEPIHGRMLTSYAAAAQANLIWKPSVWESLEEQTWPPDLMGELAPSMTFTSDTERVHERMFRAFPRPSKLDPVTEKSVTDLGWTYAADLTTTAVAVHMLRTAAADLTLVYLALPDVAGHRFWCFHEPQAFHYAIEEPFRSDFAAYVELAYVEADRLLGELLAAAPPDANTFVLSDHGMHAYEVDDPVSGTSGHHPNGPPGVFAALGPLVQPSGNLLREPVRGRLGSVLEVAPLVLHLLGVPVPEHWPAVANGARPALAQVVDGAWRRSNRMITGPSPDGEFRPATPSRLPLANVDRDFVEFFRGLGYVELEDRTEDKQ